MGQTGGKLHEPNTGPIIDYTQMDRVRVAVNNGQYDEPEVDSKGNSTKPTTQQIQKGTYAFRFPVVVPEIIDPWNVWVVSICNTNGGCSSPGDTDVLLNFPLAGFQVGDVHPLTSKKAVSFAGPYWLMGALLCMLCSSSVCYSVALLFDVFATLSNFPFFSSDFSSFASSDSKDSIASFSAGGQVLATF